MSQGGKTGVGGGEKTKTDTELGSGCKLNSKLVLNAKLAQKEGPKAGKQTTTAGHWLRVTRCHRSGSQSTDREEKRKKAGSCKISRGGGGGGQGSQVDRARVPLKECGRPQGCPRLAGHRQEEEGEGLQVPARKEAEGRGVDNPGRSWELQSKRQGWVGRETEGRKLSRIKYSYPGLYLNLSPLIRAF